MNALGEGDATMETSRSMRTVGYSNRTWDWQPYVLAHAPEGYARVHPRGIDFPSHLFKIQAP